MTHSTSHDNMSVPDRQLCGWRVRSAIPLLELAAWEGADRPPDVEIVVGAIAPHLESSERVAPHDPHGRTTLDVRPDDTALFTVVGVARFLVVQGRRVVVDPLTSDAAAVRLFLLGTVVAILCYQRRLLPLHASCLAVDGAAFAVGGRSGAGKSTLAMTLARRGIPILADDISAVDPFGESGPVVWPSVARVKLWRDSLDLLGLTADPARRIREGAEKFSASDAPFVTTPLLLSGLYHLTAGPDASVAIVCPLAGIDAVHSLNRMVYRAYIGRAIHRDDWMIRATMAVLTRVPVFAMGRDSVTDTPESLATRFLDHAHGERLRT
ncbi:MAG: serine kinase [bacterium]